MSKHFSSLEISCNCGCGIENVSEIFMLALDHFRDYCDFPVYVSSICRCLAYNKKLGGKDTSSHISTRMSMSVAADLLLPKDLKQRYIFFSGIFRCFNRIGISLKDEFVHVDIDKTKLQDIVWYYLPKPVKLKSGHREAINFNRG